MDYKDKFEQLIQDKRYEEARILLEKNHIHALEEPFYYANMGWIFNQLERYDEAIICLKKGLSLFPGDGWMYSQIAYAHNRQGNLAEGMQAIEKAFSLGFDESWLHGEKGWCLKEQREYAAAINCFEDALLEDENSVWLLAQAAYTYMELGNHEQAREYFLKCYRLFPNDDSRFDLITFYKHVKEYDKIIELLNQKSVDEREAWDYFELGNASHEIKDDHHAIIYLKQSLELGRDDTGIRTLMGDVYHNLQDEVESKEQYDIALRYYEKALLHDENSDREWIWQEMIWIAHKQKDYDKKLAYLDRASKEYPKNLWLQYHYARCYSDQNDYEKAAEACEKCIAMGEKGKEMLDLYAWNLGRCHKEETAVEILKQRIDTYGGEEWCYGELGWDYSQLKQYDAALTFFQQAFKIDPKSFMHSSMIGWSYLRLEKYEEALDYLLQAQQLGRNDGWLHAVLGEVYQGLHEDDQAIHHFEYALQHDYDETWVHEEIEKLQSDKVAS